MNLLQILVMGWDWDRFMEGIKKFPPKKVIFFCSDPGEKIRPEASIITEKICKEMKDKIDFLIESEIRYVDFYDFDAGVAALTDIFEKNKNFDEILINISGGTKLILAAVFMVSQFYPCKLLYTVPKKYNISTEHRFLTEGVKRFIQIEPLSFSNAFYPKGKESKILLLLDKRKSLTELVNDYMKIRSIIPTSDETARLKPLFIYHLKQLGAKGLVSFEIENRQKYISTTKTGKFMQAILKNKLEK